MPAICPSPRPRWVYPIPSFRKRSVKAAAFSFALAPPRGLFGPEFNSTHGRLRPGRWFGAYHCPGWSSRPRGYWTVPVAGLDIGDLRRKGRWERVARMNPGALYRTLSHPAEMQRRQQIGVISWLRVVSGYGREASAFVPGSGKQATRLRPRLMVRRRPVRVRARASGGCTHFPGAATVAASALRR